MKMLLKQPIFCGIKGELGTDKKYHFTVDFTNNDEVNDAISFVAPFYHTAIIDGVKTCWFGYEYNDNLPKPYKSACIKFLENVKEDAEVSDTGISGHDLYDMVIQSLDSIGLQDRMIDTIVYPVSSSNLTFNIVNDVLKYLPNSDRVSVYDVLKADPATLTLDIDRCLRDVESGVLKHKTFVDKHGHKREINRENLERLLLDAQRSDKFSIRHVTKSWYMREYFSDFFVFRRADRNFENAANILIIDDNKTSGSTIKEIVKIIKKYNHTRCTIYVFALTGSNPKKK